MVLNGGILGVGFCNLVQNNNCKKNKSCKKKDICHSIIHILNENLEDVNIKFIAKHNFQQKIDVTFKSGQYEIGLLSKPDQICSENANISTPTYQSLTTEPMDTSSTIYQSAMDTLPELDALCTIKMMVDNEPLSVPCHSIVFGHVFNATHSLLPSDSLNDKYHCLNQMDFKLPLFLPSISTTRHHDDFILNSIGNYHHAPANYNAQSLFNENNVPHRKIAMNCDHYI